MDSIKIKLEVKSKDEEVPVRDEYGSVVGANEYVNPATGKIVVEVKTRQISRKFIKPTVVFCKNGGTNQSDLTARYHQECRTVPAG